MPKEVKPGKKKLISTGHSDVEIYLPKADFGKAEMDLKEDKWKTCTLSLQKEETEQTEEDLQRLQNLHQTWKRRFQTRGLDEFEDIADLAGDTMEELEEPKIDKSSHRHFLKSLSEWLQGLITKKIVRTYRREMEEGDHIYRRYYRTYSTENNVYHFSLCKAFNYDVSLWSTLTQILCSGHFVYWFSFHVARPTTRAQRGQRKRQRLMNLDKQRQKAKKYTDARKRSSDSRKTSATRNG